MTTSQDDVLLLAASLTIETGVTTLSNQLSICRLTEALSILADNLRFKT